MLTQLCRWTGLAEFWPRWEDPDLGTNSYNLSLNKACSVPNKLLRGERQAFGSEAVQTELYFKQCVDCSDNSQAKDINGSESVLSETLKIIHINASLKNSRNFEKMEHSWGFRLGWLMLWNEGWCVCFLIQNTFWPSMPDSVNDLARVVCLGGLIAPSVLTHKNRVILTCKIWKVVVCHLEGLFLLLYCVWDDVSPSLESSLIKEEWWWVGRWKKGSDYLNKALWLCPCY